MSGELKERPTLYEVDRYPGVRFVLKGDYDRLLAKTDTLVQALEKIAYFGGNQAGDENLAPWQELALNPQRAVEIAQEALSAVKARQKEKENV